jgi:hypothetical protein
VALISPQEEQRGSIVRGCGKVRIASPVRHLERPMINLAVWTDVQEVHNRRFQVAARFAKNNRPDFPSTGFDR